MTKTILFLVILVFFFNSCTQQKSCSDFKTGEFRYTDKKLPVKIIRTNSIQIESDLKTNTIIKSKIEWLSECEYVLTYLEFDNFKEDLSHFINKKNFCEIIEIHKDQTLIRFRSTATNRDEVVELIKVN